MALSRPARLLLALLALVAPALVVLGTAPPSYAGTLCGTPLAFGDCEAPVALTTGPLPAGHADVLINLGSVLPPAFDRFARVAEFLDARPEVRAAGRERFKAYRARALEPQTHNV